MHTYFDALSEIRTHDPSVRAVHALDRATTLIDTKRVRVKKWHKTQTEYKKAVIIIIIIIIIIIFPYHEARKVNYVQ
jgi:hypothetical protein